MLSRLDWRIWWNGTTRLMILAFILFLTVCAFIFISQIMAHSRSQFLTQHVNCHISKLPGILNGSRLAKFGCEKLWVNSNHLLDIEPIMILVFQILHCISSIKKGCLAIYPTIQKFSSEYIWFFGKIYSSFDMLSTWEKSAMDKWMDELIKSSVTNEIDFVPQDVGGNGDPYAELEWYLEWPPIPHSHCLDVITFWGVRVFLCK